MTVRMVSGEIMVTTFACPVPCLETRERTRKKQMS
jgi:hypothetical protein